MNWAGVSIFLGLVALGLTTLPYGLIVLVPLAWFMTRR